MPPRLLQRRKRRSCGKWIRNTFFLISGLVISLTFVQHLRIFVQVNNSADPQSVLERAWSWVYHNTSRKTDSSQQRYIFVGGLQRSGTTTISDLLGSNDFTSKLSLSKEQLINNRPWEIQNISMDYFYDVVSEGAIEGKFIQDVYPYKYILDIIGRSDAAEGTIEALVRREALSASFATSGSAGFSPGLRLISQWESYWNMSKPVLIEKTPENIIMAPFLQQIFEKELQKSVYFLFTIRHPVAWALAVEKWISTYLVRLYSMPNRLAVWFAVMGLIKEQINDSDGGIKGRSEIIAIEKVTADYARKKLGPMLPSMVTGDKDPFEASAYELRLMQENVLKQSVHHIGCWLKGKSYNACKDRCTTRSERSVKSPHLYSKNRRSDLAEKNQALLIHLADVYEERANEYGYSLRAALNLINPDYNLWSRDENRFLLEKLDVPTLKSFLFFGDGTLESSLTGSLSSPSRDFSFLRASSLWGLQSASSSSDLSNQQVDSMLYTEPENDSLAAFFASRPRRLLQGTVIFAPKLNTITGTGKALGGMLQRQDSLIRSFQSTSEHTGLIYYDWKPYRGQNQPHCTKGPSTFPGIEARTQYENWRNFIQTHHIEVTIAVFFFTTPTMAMHYFAQVDVKDWSSGSFTKLGPGTEHVEMFASWIRQDFGPGVATVIVTDDIHQVRCRYILEDYPNEEVERASATLAAIESRVYGDWADVILTISHEDTAYIKSLLKNVNTGSLPSKLTPSTYPVVQPVQVEWIPFTPSIRSMQAPARLEDVSWRTGCLFIGEPHMIAVRSMSWYIREVIPRIASLAGPQAAALVIVGKNWQYKDVPESKHVTYAGYVTDSELRSYYQSRSVFVSPLLNGTGIATKIFNAVVKGMPVVTTPLGLNGFGLTQEQAQGKILVHSDPLKFSKAVVELMQNPKKWVAQTIAAREYLQAHLQPKVQRQILSRILPRFANSPGASTMLHQQLLLRSANIYPLTPKDHSSTVYDDTLNIHLQQRRILSLNKNDFDSDRSDNDDVQDGEMGSFINPGIAWLHGSIYLITARYHSGKWVDERRHRKVWKSELWIGIVDAHRLSGFYSSTESVHIGLSQIEVFTDTKDCTYDTSGRHGESTGPEDVRLFRLDRRVFAIFWAHPQVEAISAGMDPQSDCGAQIIQPFISHISVHDHNSSDSVSNEIRHAIVSDTPVQFHFQKPVPLALSSSKKNGNMQNTMGEIEKNWLPFAYSGNLFASWHFYPSHEVVKIDPETGLCTLTHTSSSQKVFAPLLRLYDRAPRRRRREFAIMHPELANGNWPNLVAESENDKDRDSLNIFGGAPPIEVFEGRNIASPSYFLGVVHVTRKAVGGPPVKTRNGTFPNEKKQGGRYYDNFFIKIASRPPFPIVAVSARIPLPTGPNVFAGESVLNTSIAFVSGLADLQHGNAVVQEKIGHEAVSDGKAYVLTYGVGNTESHTTQLSHNEIEELFTAMELVHDAENVAQNMANGMLSQDRGQAQKSNFEDDADAHIYGTDRVDTSTLVLDYKWQDDGNRVRISSQILTHISLYVYVVLVATIAINQVSNEIPFELKVKIAITVEDAKLLPEDAVYVEHTDRALHVKITDMRGIARQLNIQNLFANIRSVNVKRTNAQVTLILKKSKSAVWTSLRANNNKI